MFPEASIGVEANNGLMETPIQNGSGFKIISGEILPHHQEMNVLTTTFKQKKKKIGQS